MGEPENDRRRLKFKSPPKPEKASKSDPDGWEMIGTLKHIIIYPIEGGAGCTQEHVSSVYFSRTGLSNMLNPVTDIADKGIIAFSGKNMQAKIRSHDMVRNLDSNTLYEAISKKLENDFENLETVKIDYFADTENERIEVKDLGDDIALMVKNMVGNSDVDLRLGVRNANERCTFNFNIRNKQLIPKSFPENEINLYSDNFSSFTLVNTNHIKKLSTRCGKTISYKNFRPNLVVEGKNGDPYNEKDVAQIKICDDINTVVFPIVRAWSHNININENELETPEHLLGEPYNTLLKEQPLATIYNEKCTRSDLPDVPVFGLNLEMLYESEEKIEMLPGGKVFAKYKVPKESASVSQQEDTDC